MSNYIKKEKGITLIALVITIIVIIILAGVTINLTMGNNGLINRTGYTKETFDLSQMIEEVRLVAMDSSIQGKGKINGSYLKEKLKQYNNSINDSDITGNEEEGWNLRINNTVLYISPEGNTNEVIDRSGINEGDYVNYNAGVWSEEDITSIGSLYYGENIPDNTATYTFGGFKAGQSRDIGVLKGDNNISQLDTEHTGWRVLKVNYDASISLIHAGASEWYYHPTRCVATGKTDYQKLAGSAVRSRYILKGEKDDEEQLQFTYEGYEPRNWGMYENSFAIQGSAHVVTRDEILKGDWAGAGSQWQRIIGINFWTEGYYYNHIGAISRCFYDIETNKGHLQGYGRNVAEGIRPVVILKPECIFNNINENEISTHNTPDTAWELTI